MLALLDPGLASIGRGEELVLTRRGGRPLLSPSAFCRVAVGDMLLDWIYLINKTDLGSLFMISMIETPSPVSITYIT